jgi:hypothetical protein
MNLRKISRHIGQCGGSLYVMKSTNRKKFDRIMSFDKDQYKAVMFYKQYVMDLFFEITEAINGMPNNELKKHIVKAGYNENSVYMFLNIIYKPIDDENFTRISLDLIDKLEILRQGLRKC